MSEELKPCPFCGSYAEIFNPGGEDWFYIECFNCCIRTEKYPVLEFAIEKWNARA